MENTKELTLHVYKDIKRMATNVTAQFEDERFIERRATDMLFDIQKTVVQELSHKIIAEKGKDLIYDALAKTREIQVKIEDKVKAELEEVVFRLVKYRTAFEKGDLCTCSDLREHHERLPAHQFKSMDNLQFVEFYSDYVNKWLDGFKAMVVACPTVRDVDVK